MNAWRTSLTLLATLAIAMALLHALASQTDARRRDMATRTQMAALRALLPPSLPADTLQLTRIPGDEATPLWLFTSATTGQGLIVVATAAARGYNDDIVVQAAFDREGQLLGARIVSHRETAAYTGDLGARWQASAKRDGPAIDQLSSATVSAKAIDAAIANARQHAHDRWPSETR
jgi:electron transport complex protein RnfG